MIERLHAECQLQFPLNHRGFRPGSGPLFRRLLKTQPGASACGLLDHDDGVIYEVTMDVKNFFAHFKRDAAAPEFALSLSSSFFDMRLNSF